MMSPTIAVDGDWRSRENDATVRRGASCGRGRIDRGS
jgi:hypothetical protein